VVVRLRLDLKRQNPLMKPSLEKLIVTLSSETTVTRELISHPVSPGCVPQTLVSGTTDQENP
jgi:hypothetical protein